MLGAHFSVRSLWSRDIARPIPLPQCRFIPPLRLPLTYHHQPFFAKPAHPALFFTRVPGGLSVQDSLFYSGYLTMRLLGFTRLLSAHAHAPRPGGVVDFADELLQYIFEEDHAEGTPCSSITCAIWVRLRCMEASASSISVVGGERVQGTQLVARGRARRTVREAMARGVLHVQVAPCRFHRCRQ